MKSLKPGDLLKNRFRIEAVIGQGAYGMVYRASDLTIEGAQWAVKEMGEGTLSDGERAEALQLFRKEGEILKELNHTGIPKVVDFFSLEHRHYIVMEYIEGTTIEALAKEEKPDPKVVLQWALKACDILEYLHGLSPPVIFRDLKPSNIMVTGRGRLMLIDFGIARFFSPVKKKDTAIMGTPGFSPPEQYGAGQSDCRSDIYSLGATIYHLLSGEDLEQYNFDIPPLSRQNHQVTPALESVAGRCLAKDPADRYQGAGELKKDLEKVIAGGTVSPILAVPAVTRQASPQAKVTGAARKASPLPFAAVGAAWLLLVILAGVDIYRPEINPFGPIDDPFLIGNGILTFAGILYYLVKKRIDIALTIAVLVFVLPAVIVPNFLRAHAGGQLTACKSNLKNIGTAMEMYASDNEKHYPPALSSVTPNYLKTLPTCASAGKMTYMYIHSADMKCYTAWCTEKRHPGVRLEPGFPQYDSVNGLYENAGQFR